MDFICSECDVLFNNRIWSNFKMTTRMLYSFNPSAVHDENVDFFHSINSSKVWNPRIVLVPSTACPIRLQCWNELFYNIFFTRVKQNCQSCGMVSDELSFLSVCLSLILLLLHNIFALQSLLIECCHSVVCCPSPVALHAGTAFISLQIPRDTF